MIWVLAANVHAPPMRTVCPVDRNLLVILSPEMVRLSPAEATVAGAVELHIVVRHQRYEVRCAGYAICKLRIAAVLQRFSGRYCGGPTVSAVKRGPCPVLHRFTARQRC